MISEYSQWFFDSGWLLVTAMGFAGGLVYGLRIYWLVLPMVFAAVIAR